MNIVVRTASGKVVVRPDTTWERDNEDFYVPEFVDGLSAAKVLYVHVSKPGRSVGEKFAERYYDGFGRGVLLYPEELLDGSEEGYACASCLDHTSFLPGQYADKETLSPEERALICETIALVTRYCYIRIGDLIAIETTPREHLCSRSEKEATVNEGDCSFRIIF